MDAIIGNRIVPPKRCPALSGWVQFCVTIALLVFGPASTRAARIVYVNQSAPATSSQDGSSWANAYRELRDALNSPSLNPTPSNPVEIWVARGTYKPTASTNRNAAFVLKSHLRILGGFAGFETTDAHRLYVNAPVLSGDIGTPQSGRIDFTHLDTFFDPDDPAVMDNSYNVLTCVGVKDVILDLLIVTGGNARLDPLNNSLTELEITGMAQPRVEITPGSTNKGEALSPPDRRVIGGGLFFQNVYERPLDEVTLIINNCFFVNNYSSAYGAAVGGNEARLQISFTLFQNNVAELEGGAFWGLNQRADFFKCEFVQNEAGEAGGAVVYRTLTSDRTMPDFLEQGRQEMHAQVQRVVSYTTSAQKQAYKLQTGQSVFHKVPRYYQKLKNLFKTSTVAGPKLGLVTRVKNGVRSGVNAIKSANKMKLAANVYEAVSTAVTVGDIVFDLSAAFGADTNNDAARGWVTFSTGFNTYATPEGWSLLLADVIYEEMGGPPIRNLAYDTKEFQLLLYNQSPYESMRHCRFVRNIAAEGGAIFNSHDNLHLEGCTFEENVAENGGAIASGSWTTPILISCSFSRNNGTLGHSAIANQLHSRAQILNCTFADNYCDATNGFCIGIETGSEVRIVNSILWGNTNAEPANATGGADIFTATRETLLDAPETLALYDSAGGAYGDWIGICEISSSCVQSLSRLPTGVEDFVLFPEHRPYSNFEIQRILDAFARARTNGTLESHGFINVGQGNWFGPGNMNANPLLNGVVPSAFSPVINLGHNNRFNNGILNSRTGVDILESARVHGSAIDMGAVEHQGYTNSGGILYVKLGATGDGTGRDWQNAITNLQDALNRPGAEIWVAIGTYYPTTGTNRDVSFRITNNVQVFGGFFGDETKRAQRNPASYQTILSGNIGNPNIDTDNSHHVVYTFGIGPETILDGFIITRGRGDYGAGMYNSGASPTVRNCKFISNQASASGGAIYASDNNVALVEQCEFVFNSAQFGGAIHYSSGVNVQNCRFERNSATLGGAAMISQAGTASFYNCLFFNNSIAGVSSGHGGAIYSSGSSTHIYNCTIVGNTLSVNNNTVTGGAGLEFEGPGSLTLENSIFWQNSVANAGASPASVERQQIQISSGSVSSLAYNLIQGLASYATFGVSNIVADPAFEDAINGNFRLRNFSPAIDAGRLNQGPGFPAFDLARQPRVANATTDMGAYEFQQKPLKLSSLLTIVSTCDGVGNIYRFQLVTNSVLGSYYWEVDRNDGSGFIALANDTFHSGALSAVLTVTHPSAAMNGFRYRVRSGDFISEAAVLKVSAAVLYVKADAAGNGTGTNWVNAFTSLQSALAAAAPCTEIWVTAGTYRPTGSSSDRNAAFQLRSRIALYGGFAGNETSRGQRNWLTNVTVLSGAISGSFYALDNSKHIFVNDGSSPANPIDATAVLDGFTLFGSTEGSILNISASPTVQNCILIDSKRAAGAIVNTGNSTPTVAGCTFMQAPYVVCSEDAGTSLIITSQVASEYHWQVNSGSGFSPIQSGGNYTITTNSAGSTLSILAAPLGNDYRFAIPGTGYVSPSLRIYSGQPSVVYVNAAVVGGTRDGTTWANAYADLFQAISSASDCAEIWVVRGAYQVNSNQTGLTSFELRSGLALYGGFAGNETNRNQRNVTLNPTVLRQVGNNPVIDNAGTTIPIDSSAMLDGFLFTNNVGMTVINNQTASPTIRNCTFVGNRAIPIFSQNSQPAIVGCVFSNNLNTAIYNRDSAGTVTSNLFAGQATAYLGGAIYNSGSSPRIDGCTFKNNTAGWGGAIANSDDAAPLVLRCIFESNTSGNGGAIYNSGDTAVIIRNSLFFRNTTPQFRGGAVADYGNTLNIVNCTFTENTAGYSGGGLYLQGDNTTVQNSILWHNSAGSQPYATLEAAQIDRHSGSLQVSNSLVEGLNTLPGTNNLAFDPLFEDTFSNDFRLTLFSPAIDAGQNPGVDAIDLDGFSRVVAGGIDLGAYEFRGPAQGVVRLLASPESQSTCEGNPVSFTVVGVPGTNYTYHWQVHNGVSGFLDIVPGGVYSITNSSNSSTLRISAAAFAMNNYRYRISVGAFDSAPATLQVSRPNVIYVSQTATGLGDGTSWTNAFTNFHTALNAANECSQIWVARGNYAVADTQGNSLSLQMKRGVKIFGGFGGFPSETSINQRNWTTNISRLVGTSDQPLFNNLGYLAPIDSSAVLDGFALTGGAIVNWTASPVFRNCTIENVNGLAVENISSANATFENCIFRNNTNGALANTLSSVIVSNCLFEGNSTSAFPGGAMRNSGANVTILDSQFLNNSSRDAGGAIDSRGGTTTVARCTFANNTAVEGGALSFLHGCGEVQNSLLVSNVASLSGGAITVDNNPTAIRNCTIVNNSSLGGGGGLFVLSGAATAVNSIFWHNRDRFAPEAIERAQVYPYGGTISISWSCIERLSEFVGSQNIGFDPLFNNPDASDFTLTRYSPLLNAGNSAAASQDAIDLTRATRNFDGTVDIGAYELPNFLLEAVALFSTPESQTVCAGRDASFTVTAYTNAGSEFRWARTSGSNWINIINDSAYRIIAGPNTSTLIVSNTSAAMNGTRLQFSLPNQQSFDSAELTLTVTAPEILYVNATATGNQSGASWANAFTNLQGALNIADLCTEIWVARGTYIPTAANDGRLSFKLPRSVKVYGGFAGNETLLSQRNWTTNQTILLGSLNDTVVRTSGTEVDRFTVLDGFTVTSRNGQWGMHNSGSSPIIRNCKFSNNDGIAMINWSGSSPLIESCFFTNNQGTAIYSGDSDIEVTNCTFVGNREGAIFNSRCSSKISYCLFDGNSGASSGSGVSDSHSESTISYCIFRNNNAGRGGGVGSESSFTTVINSLFHGNISQHTGGALDSILSLLRIVNCTITENFAPTRGGGISQSGGTNQILNTILWNNADVYSPAGSSGAQVTVDAGSQVVSNSCVQYWTAQTSGNFDFDPLFNNAAAKDYTLQTYSPAVDAGATQFSGGLVFDLAGDSRERGSSIDIGAYEFRNASFNPVRIVSQPSSRTVCPGDTTTFTVVGTNGSGSSFYWQYNIGSGWGTLGGPLPFGSYSTSTTSTSSTLTVSGIVTNMNGYLFRPAVSGASYDAPPVTLTVSPPGVIYVNAVAAAGGDGRSWATAFNNLATALTAAGPCRPEIWVAAGTYLPPARGFEVPSGVALYGGFLGNETNHSQRNWEARPTVLNGDIGVPVTLVSLDRVATNTVLDGFIVERSDGFGVSVFQCSPKIRNCVVRQISGYALYIEGNPLVENCSFLSNSNASSAVIMYSSSPTIRNCIIAGNLGNGIDTSPPSSPLILNCLITGNAGTGVSFVGSGSPEIRNCTISGNRGQNVGGVDISGSSSLTIYNSILWNNRSVLGQYNIEQTQLRLSGSSSLTMFNTCVEEYTEPISVTHFNVDSDPLFVAPVSPNAVPATGGNYRLQACSPLIGQGYNFYATSIAWDLDGLPRTNGVVEMGAYEYHGPAGNPIVIETNPVSITYCPGAVNRFWIAASGAGAYQWEVDDGTGFQAVSDGAFYSGSTTAELTITNATVSMNGHQYRCVVTSGGDCTAFSQSVTLTVKPNRWFVNSAAPTGGDGLSWSNAFRTIGAALSNPDLVLCQSEIWVARGTGVYDEGISLRTGVAIYGGFVGTEAVLAQRDLVANETILTRTTNIVFASGVTGLARVDGFTMTNSDTAIRLFDSHPAIANCRFINNRAVINCFRSSPAITGCAFLANGAASVNGSALRTYESQPVFSRCVFSGNQGQDAIIYDERSTTAFSDCLFSGNTGAELGGVIFNAFSSTTLRNCTITGNRARYNAPIYSMSLVTVYNSIVWANSSGFTSGGGGYTYVDSSRNQIDPQFLLGIDPATAPATNGNFRLSVCSPLVNAANNAHVAGSVDLDGNPRAFDGTVDMGAYETQAVAPRLTASPLDQTGSITVPVSFAVTASHTNVVYQWQVTTNVAGAFRDVTNDFNHIGATTSTLTLTNQFVAMNNWEYRCRVSTVEGCVLFSQSAFYRHIHILTTNSAPHSGTVVRNSDISLSLSQDIDPASAHDGAIAVNAMETGRLRSTNGDIAGISVTNATVTLNPARDFKAGERVFVTATRNVKTPAGHGTVPFVWEFRAGVNSTSNQMFDLQSQLAAGSSVQDMAAGDLNRDQWNDIFIAGSSGDSVWLNNGSGSFTNSQSFGSGGSMAVQLGDLDGDGWLDAVVAKTNTGIRIYRNNHSSLTDSGVSLAGVASEMALADFDGDGDLDLVAGETNALQIWRNDGSGNFASTQVVPAVQVTSLAVGDFDRDGDLDVVSTHRTGPARVWSNNGSGQFADGGQSLNVSNGAKVQTGDLNGDGYLDAIISSRDSFATIWTNAGPGVFVRPLGNFLSPGDPVSNLFSTFTSPYRPQNAIDGNPQTKFVAGDTSGNLMIEPIAGPMVATGIRLTFAADSIIGRHPRVVGLYGGSLGNFTSLLYVNLPTFQPPGTVFTFMFTNTTAYSSYFVDFPFAETSSGRPQIAEVELLSPDLPQLGSAPAADLVLGDIDGDAHLDVCTIRSNGVLEFWRNDGNARFASFALSRAASAGKARLADLNNDGALDILQGNGSFGTVSPLATIDYYVVENTPATLSSNQFASRFSVAGGGSLEQVRVLSLPAHGALSLSGAPVMVNQAIASADLDTLLYTPPPWFFGIDSFSWQGAHITGFTSNQFRTRLFVQNVQQAPVSVNDTILVSQGGTATVLTNGSNTVLSNDSDPDGDLLRATVVQQPARGLLLLNADGAFTYTHDGSEPVPSTYSDTFIYQARDDYGNSSQATVFVWVTDVNTAPADILLSNSRVLENSPTGTVVGTLSAIDADPGDTHLFTLVAGAGADNNSAFTIDGANLKTATTFNFLAQSNYTIRVRAADLQNATFEKIIALQVSTVPVAINQSVTTNENSSIEITLTASDLDGDSLSFSILVPPTNGILSGTPPLVTYTPNLNYDGTDSFSFLANDGQTNSAPGVVTITLMGVNQAPVANPQSLTIPEDTATNLVLTASDVDANPLTFHIVGQPAHGTVTTNLSGNVTYTPATNYVGTDNFSFYAHDGTTSSTPAMVSITITAVNDSPVALDQEVVIYPEMLTPIQPSAYDPDHTFFQLQFALLTAPTNGTLAGSAPYWTYRPRAGYIGEDRLTFTVHDGQPSMLSTGRIHIVVSAPNIVVTNAADVGPGTLRAAFDAIRFSGGSTSLTWTITFATNLQTISLTSQGFINNAALAFQQPNHSLAIDGVGAPGLVIERDSNAPPMRLLNFSGVNLTIRNLTLRNGYIRGGDGMSGNGGGGGGEAALGGVLYTESVATLHLTNVIVADSRVVGGNGGSWNSQITSPANGGGRFGGTGGTVSNKTGGNGSFEGGGGGAGPDAGVGRPGTGGYRGGAGGGDSASAFAAGGSGAFGGGGGGGSFAGGGGGLGGGGAIYVNYGTVYVEGCVFTGNYARGGLGGAGMDTNTAGANGQGIGGAIFVRNGPLQAYNCQFEGNSADAGNAIFGLAEFQRVLIELEGVTNDSASDVDGEGPSGMFAVVPPVNPKLQVAYGSFGNLEIVPFGSQHAITAGTQGSAGSVTFDSRYVTYSHNSSPIFRDSFTLQITGPHGGVSSCSVTVNIDQVQFPPVANPDSAIIYAGRTVTIAVLRNDTDPNDDVLTITGVTPPSSGMVTFTPTNLTYQQTGVLDDDTFGYIITDGQGGRATGTVSIVVGTTASLRANADAAITDQNTAVVLDVVGNDEPAGWVSIMSVATNSLRGHVTITNGTLAFDPARRFNRLQVGQTNSTSFTYVITDPLAGRSTGAVTIAVSGLNDAPIARPLEIKRFAGTREVKIAKSLLLAYVPDVDGDVVTISLPTVTDGGNQLADGGTELVYNPTDAFNSDTFRYSAEDPRGARTTNVVTFVVTTFARNHELQLFVESQDRTLGFSGTLGQSYSIQYTTNVAAPSWIDLGPAMEGPPTLFYFRDVAPADSMRLYRIVSP